MCISIWDSTHCVLFVCWPSSLFCVSCRIQFDKEAIKDTIRNKRESRRGNSSHIKTLYKSVADRPLRQQQQEIKRRLSAWDGSWESSEINSKAWSQDFKTLKQMNFLLTILCPYLYGKNWMLQVLQAWTLGARIKIIRGASSRC